MKCIQQQIITLHRIQLGCNILVCAQVRGNVYPIINPGRRYCDLRNSLRGRGDTFKAARERKTQTSSTLKQPRVFSNTYIYDIVT